MFGIEILWRTLRDVSHSFPVRVYSICEESQSYMPQEPCTFVGFLSAIVHVLHQLDVKHRSLELSWWYKCGDRCLSAWGSTTTLSSFLSSPIIVLSSSNFVSLHWSSVVYLGCFFKNKVEVSVLFRMKMSSAASLRCSHNISAKI